jgi:tight adherence protein B
MIGTAVTAGMTMNLLVGAALVGSATAIALLAFLQYRRDRQLRHRSLEQVGLRQREVSVSKPALADRRRMSMIGIGLLVAGAGGAAFGPIGLVVGAAPVVVDSMLSRRAAKKRTAQLAAELAPALQLLVDNIRVGRDLVSAMAEVAESSADPVSSLFESVVSEVRLGARVDLAFAQMAELEGDRHLGVIASAIGLNVEFGGNLVEILSAVVETLEEEDRLRRDIDRLTADGRLSGQVLLGLPVVTLLVVSLMNPGYAAPLVTTPSGRMLSGVGAVMGFVGWAWLRKLSNPDVVA